MRRAIRAKSTCIAQGTSVTLVGFHLATARRIHRRKVWVRDNDLVTERLDATSDPLAFGRGLHQDPSRRSLAQKLLERLASRRDAKLKISPSTVWMHNWLETLCTSMPIFP
ncbi:MAG: hypothetical protein IPK60_17005 [Sandaracinaceae bacterium]|nr:hypothetical protein [Sandaracinaceae bacterium]